MSQWVYYVEGEDERTLITSLKSELKVIHPGTVKILNLVNHKITNYERMQLTKDTIAVFVFDTDVEQLEQLEENISILKKTKRDRSLKDFIFILQVPNLEGELLRSCNISRIREFLNSKTDSDFKTDMAQAKGLHYTLKRHSFDIDKFWCTAPRNCFSQYENSAHKVKLKQK